MCHVITWTRADVDSFPPLLSSWSDSVPLLHPAYRAYPGFMGTYHVEFDRTCGHVLVLLSSCARHSYLVERMDHQTPNRTVCHRPWYAPLSQLFYSNSGLPPPSRPAPTLMLEPGFVYYATYNYYINKYIPSLPHVGTCGGEEFAAFTGCATLSSYLVLFISFYAATYKKASTKDKRSTLAMSTSIPSDAVHELERKKMPTMMETSETAVDALHCAEGLMKAAGTSIVSTTHDLHLMGGGK